MATCLQKNLLYVQKWPCNQRNVHLTTPQVLHLSIVVQLISCPRFFKANLEGSQLCQVADKFFRQV